VSPGIDHNKMRYDATVFFVLANHLPDWMKEDSAPQCLMVKADDCTASENDALGLVNSFANTSKHHTMRRGRKVSVFVDAVGRTPQGWSAEVVSQRPDHPIESECDALDLAGRIMRIWETHIGKGQYVVPPPAAGPTP
jgi:hypothetical protein